MSKKKKRNKGKKKAVCCPITICKVKTKKNKGLLTVVEMMELCDRIKVHSRHNKMIIC
jgi:hypothetical protein